MLLLLLLLLLPSYHSLSAGRKNLFPLCLTTACTINLRVNTVYSVTEAATLMFFLIPNALLIGCVHHKS